MKKLTLLLALFVLFSDAALAQLNFPEPKGYVNDFANILSDETEQQITEIIQEIKDKTSAEVAVVTIESLEGYEVNSYAVEMGRAWGIGNKERDDGVLFLTAVQDHTTYIATGYGVEPYITDAQAFWITDRTVVPYFKNDDYDGGILAGVEKIKAALVDLEPLPEASSSSESGFDFGSLVFWFFILFGFVLPWLTAVFGRSKRWWPGGIVGLILATIIALLFGITLFIIIPFALFGFLFDYLASKNYKQGKNRWWTGGGSSGWGGGSGFGGGSSGGFGGFGGGSFGGGGGGSRW
ncbi:MAG: TPM domain-containing protein [bacterium]|nr:TPM domain-containing protein [bacterium]